MANIIEVIRNSIRPYYYYIITTVVFILFLLVGFYSYNYYKNQVKDRFKDVANVNRRNKEVIVYFFHVDWCPHCKKALPEWNAFMDQYDGKEVNGYIIRCMPIDCTEESSTVKTAMNKYNINSFPTVKLIRDEKTIEFDSKITRTSLSSFVETMLNN